MATQALTTGFYLRTQVTPHNFQFTMPKEGKGASYDSMDELFKSIGGGSKNRNQSSGGEKTPKGTKSTLSSDWYICFDAHKEIGNKINYAPQIYGRAQGNDDVQQAETAVKEYKQHALKVMQRYYDQGQTPDEAMAAEINTKSCIVFEVKVFLMRVSDQPIDGIQPSKKDGLYRQSKVARKFFTFLQPREDLLNAFSEVLAEVGTNVDYLGQLILVRSDGFTPRTGRAAGKRHFRIERTNSIGSSNDQQLSELVAKIFAKRGG